MPVHEHFEEAFNAAERVLGKPLTSSSWPVNELPVDVVGIDN